MALNRKSIRVNGCELEKAAFTALNRRNGRVKGVEPEKQRR